MLWKQKEKLDFFSSLSDVFYEQIKQVPNCQEPTRAYMMSVFDTTKNISTRYATDSLTLILAKAKFENNFHLYQQLGDCILFMRSVFPAGLNGASEDYYNAIGQESYYRCYRILNKKMQIFEELADMLPQYINYLQSNLLNFK